MRSPEITDRFAKAGVEVAASTPEFFNEFLKSEVARWAKVVQDANIKAD
jgi:tripartite-type tricarboxylate transporter receptor subunit TctC